MIQLLVFLPLLMAQVRRHAPGVRIEAQQLDPAGAAIHPDPLTILQAGEGVLDGHDGGDLHLPGGDGAVGQGATAFRDHGGGTIE